VSAACHGRAFDRLRRRWLREPAGRFRSHAIAVVKCRLCGAEVADAEGARRNHERGHLLEHLAERDAEAVAEVAACAVARAFAERVVRARAAEAEAARRRRLAAALEGNVRRSPFARLARAGRKP
jgi:hypothetical protein